MSTPEPLSRPRLKARFHMVSRMVEALDAVATLDRAAGRTSWAQSFEDAAEAVERLAAELEMELDGMTPREVADAART